jgi:hypothetical protein
MTTSMLNESKVRHFVDHMASTTPGATRAKLDRALAAIRRGDLQHAPHHKPAIVKMLRTIAAELQGLAVLTLGAATRLHDANSVDAVCKAGIDADESLTIVRDDLKGREE